MGNSKPGRGASTGGVALLASRWRRKPRFLHTPHLSPPPSSLYCPGFSPLLFLPRLPWRMRGGARGLLGACVLAPRRRPAGGEERRRKQGGEPGKRRETEGARGSRMDTRRPHGFFRKGRLASPLVWGGRPLIQFPVA